MFALRASCSSVRATVARRPVFIARALSTTTTTTTTTDEDPHALSFLGGASVSSEPTPFKIEDGPPTSNFPIAGSSFDSTFSPNNSKPKYRLHCHSSRNNTIVTFTKPDGSTIAWASGGSCGFKKSNRAGYEAGYQCAKAMFEAIRKEQEVNKVALQLELFFKGFGEGREAMKTALLGAEGAVIRPLVTRVTDRTPLKIGGTRSKKTRRV